MEKDLIEINNEKAVRLWLEEKYGPLSCPDYEKIACIGTLRAQAKLFLNNLYGIMAASTDQPGMHSAIYADTDSIHL